MVIDEKQYKSAIEKGFNVLAGYIFGNNVSKQKIEMTSPVQASQSEKIAMTTPVTVTGEFELHGGFHHAVCIHPGNTPAAERQPGPTSSLISRPLAGCHPVFWVLPGKIQSKKNKQRLSQWLLEQNLETEGDFIVAGYNPPWVPGFLARNEILIPIKTEPQLEKELMRYLILYLFTLAAFLAMDMLWLGLAARSFISRISSFLMVPSPNWFAAILFYILFVVGLLVFVVSPGLATNSLKTTLLHVAPFGLIAYATYDLTNLATLKDWPALLSIVDMLWGTVLSVLVSYIKALWPASGL